MNIEELYYNGQPLSQLGQSNGHKPLRAAAIRKKAGARAPRRVPKAPATPPEPTRHVGQQPPTPPPPADGGFDVAEVLSPSQLFKYLDCSARWYYRYALRLPDPADSGRALGRSVHKAMEVNFRQKINSHRDLSAGEVLDAFRASWEEERHLAVFQPDESPGAIGKLGEVLAKKYLAEAAPHIQPARIEERVEGVIGGVRVQGYVDLIDVDGRIVDLKTVKATPPAVRPDQRLQVATYYGIAAGVSGAARIDNLIKTKTPKISTLEFTVGSQDIKLTEALYPLAQAGMRSGLVWPNRNSFTCSQKHCAYWRQCTEEYGGVVKGGKEEARDAAL